MIEGRTVPGLKAKSFAARAILRLRAACPSFRETILGAPAWAVVMGLSALFGLYLRLRAETFNLGIIVTIYLFGGLLSWPFALLAARCVGRGKSAETRFAAAFLCLSLSTILMTAFLFAMQYRIYYAQWHAPFGTPTWAFQFVFTSAGAVYQFLVMGLGLFLPLGFVALCGASLWLARRM